MCVCGVIFPLAPFYGKRACVYCDMDFSTCAVTRQRIILTKRKTLHKMPPVIVNATDSSLKHFDLDGFFKCFGSGWRHWVCECACAYDKLYTMTYLGRKKGKNHSEELCKRNSKRHYWERERNNIMIWFLLPFAWDIKMVTFKLSLFIQKSGTINFKLVHFWRNHD